MVSAYFFQRRKADPEGERNLARGELSQVGIRRGVSGARIGASEQLVIVIESVWSRGNKSHMKIIL